MTNNKSNSTKSDEKQNRSEIIDGYTIQYNVTTNTKFSKGKMKSGRADGCWEWYRPDGTVKRVGHFDNGEPIGKWITFDKNGNVYSIKKKK